MKLLITGIARSGTKYAATVITRAGARCGHEKAFTLRTRTLPAKLPRCESSWPAAQWLPSLRLLSHPPTIIAQIREPGRWLRSWLDVVLPRTFAFLDWSLPRMAEAAPTAEIREAFAGLRVVPRNADSGARLWIAWNLWCDHFADATVQVERLPALLQPLVVQAGLASHPLKVAAAIRSTPSNVNARPHNRSRQESLALLSAPVRADFLALGQRFGYEDPPCPKSSDATSESTPS